MAGNTTIDPGRQIVVQRLGMSTSDPRFKDAVYSANSLLDQGYSIDNVEAQLRADGYGSPAPSTSSGGGSGTTKWTGGGQTSFGAPPGTVVSTTNTDLSMLALVQQRLGYTKEAALNIIDAVQGNQGASVQATAIKVLGNAGIQPYADIVANAAAKAGGGGGGGGGGGSGPAWTPLDDANLQKILLANRQTSALFDPNYADGQWVPMPDGTMRLNGTEITIDTRQKGQFKPVDGAPGYFVDPLTGNVIDTQGHQIALQQLQETIRSNKAQEAQSKYATDVTAELGRGRLALDTVTGIGDLNLRAATSENEQALQNQLETNKLNEQAFSDTGNLNIGATNAETSRLNALTTRTTNAGQLANDLQKLQDARTQAVIALMARPEDFVQREYASRALNAPAGYTGPAFRDNPAAQQAISSLLGPAPDVSGLLPTYQQPHYNTAVLPNASLPRVTAPAPQPQAVYVAPVATDITGQPYTNTNVAPENAAESANLRSQGVPDWAAAPLGYAYGTDKGKNQKRNIPPLPSTGPVDDAKDAVGAKWFPNILGIILDGLKGQLQDAYQKTSPFDPNNKFSWPTLPYLQSPPDAWPNEGGFGYNETLQNFKGKPQPQKIPNYKYQSMEDWVNQNEGFAKGTKGTTERRFITGDPQADQSWQDTNPELNTVHNPGPNTTVEVQPLRDMASKALIPDQVKTGAEMQQESQSGGLGKLLADVLINIANQWGATGGVAKYADGTGNLGGYPDFSSIRSAYANTPVADQMGKVFDTVSNFQTAHPVAAPPTEPTNPNNTTAGMFRNYLASRQPESPIGTSPGQSFDWNNIYNTLRGRFAQRWGTLPNWAGGQQNNQAGINPRWDNNGLSYYAQGTGKKKTQPNPYADYDQADQTGMYAYGTNGVDPTAGNKIAPNYATDNSGSGGSGATAYNPSGSGSLPGNPNLDYGGNYTGPRDSAGNPLGTITTYPDQAIRSLPSVQYLLGNLSRTAYTALPQGGIYGAFGTRLPSEGGLNYGQLLQLQQDPDAWGLLSSLYASGNRNLDSILARVRDRAPIGNITEGSLVRTGG